jgi:lactoylglutathione lyase
MIIRQLAHLCFFTHQLDVMVAFYRDKLGFPVAFTMRTDDGFQFGYYFDVGNTTFIEIFDQAGAVKLWGLDAVPRKPNDGVYFGHFCLEVLGLDETCAELRARGVEILRPIKTGIDHSRQAWIKDPDGNSIELMEYSARSLQLTEGVQGKHVPRPSA